jgi:hypothetical protein
MISGFSVKGIPLLAVKIKALPGLTNTQTDLVINF